MQYILSLQWRSGADPSYIGYGGKYGYGRRYGYGRKYVYGGY